MKTNQKTKHKKIYTVPNKVFIKSAYPLTAQEIDDLRKKYELIGDNEIETIVDDSILAGIIIQAGTRQMDLSLSGGLQNFKNYMYESR